MKRIFLAAITAILFMGAALTQNTASANPFVDVPKDHWAYEAIDQLTANGVIEGYGDTTFRGERNITRYEAAKIVAAAMAKIEGKTDEKGKPIVGAGISRADKALIDRLAAEFSDELNGLGVRVANLERNADNVKWTGELRYAYWSNRNERADGSQNKRNTNRLELRMFPTAEINKNWHMKARITARDDMNSDTTKLTISISRADMRKIFVSICVVVPVGSRNAYIKM